jgi:hypothetical protein
MAQEYILAASAARTASASGTATLVGGFHKRALIVLDVTASATAAGDTGDFYVDVSPDGVKWLPAIHYAQQAGNGAAKTEFAILDPTNPGTATIAATSDPAAGAVRPGAWGKYMRARWVLVDGGGADTSHTFSIKAYVQ